MADENKPSLVRQEVLDRSTDSVVTLIGHPLHALLVHFPIALVFAGLTADVFYWYTGDPFWMRAAVWAVGAAFGMGVLAGLAGTAELLLVSGIRARVSSWAHAIAAMTFLAAVGTNWGLRLGDPEAVLPHGLALSVLSSVLVGLAGWHGGALVYHQGLGVMVSDD